MNTELISKAFSSPSLYKELIALSGGTLGLILINLWYRPELSGIPNWSVLGSMEKIFSYAVVAYSLGQILLYLGAKLTNLVSIDINRTMHASFITWWKEFFKVERDKKQITDEELRELTLNSATRKFILEHQGLTSELTRLLIQVYFVRIFLGISGIAFLASIISMDALSYTTFAGLLTLYILVVTLSAISLKCDKNVNSFEYDIARLFLKEKAERQRQSL